MIRKLKETQINFNGKMVSIGIGMLKRPWPVTTLADEETVLAFCLLLDPAYGLFSASP